MMIFIVCLLIVLKGEIMKEIILGVVSNEVKWVVNRLFLECRILEEDIFKFYLKI